METKTIKIKGKAPEGKPLTCSNMSVSLSDGTDLGYVQSLTLDADVQSGLPHLTIKTLCSEIELEQLQENTELIVTVLDREAYSKGFNTSDPNPYALRSYGHYLFELARKDSNEKGQ